jgi:acetyl esterase
MNWKVKLVLLFARIRKPIDASTSVDIASLRKKSDRATWLGTFLFDRKVKIFKTTDTTANGIPVRIYQNSEAKNQRVIIYYHGGGFVLYGIYSHNNVCKRLCQMNNCMVVSVDYRLAPEHTFPAAHNDAFNALQWVRENISAYGGNPDDLVVAGDSAGGNLSACMAHRCKKENIPLKAQVLVYPWIDGKLNNPSIEKNGQGFLLEKETMFWFQEQYTPRSEDHCVPEISPCYENDFSGLAPAFIITAQYDPLLDDGFKYHQQLKTAGNKTRYCEYKEMFHGFFSLPLMHPLAMQTYFDIQQFLKEL